MTTPANDYPVYKQSYILLQDITLATKHFPRNYKLLMGTELRNSLFEVLMCISKASIFKEDKIIYIQKAINNIDFLKVATRLCLDLKFISIDKYAYWVESLINISKQLKGWESKALKARDKNAVPNDR